jgi:hypothetical protein
MGRVTITLSDRDHRAFKLLALQQDKKILVLIQQAVGEYLERTGAYDLSITGGKRSGDEV